MKQWVTVQDGIKNLKQEEVAVPSPRDGEVLVEILTVSLNYRDTEGRQQFLASNIPFRLWS
jgi:NADPH:quinone reductase-like Zn-dependent oxidoreductase